MPPGVNGPGVILIVRHSEASIYAPPSRTSPDLHQRPSARRRVCPHDWPIDCQNHWQWRHLWCNKSVIPPPRPFLRLKSVVFQAKYLSKVSAGIFSWQLIYRLRPGQTEPVKGRQKLYSIQRTKSSVCLTGIPTSKRLTFVLTPQEISGEISVSTSLANGVQCKIQYDRNCHARVCVERKYFVTIHADTV